MKGVLLPGNREVVVTSFANPKPAIGEAVVRVKASAICRSDLSLYYGNAVLPGVVNPVISGHEPAGIVEEVGPGVTSVKPGDRVAVYLAVGCGHCQYCRHGDLQLCPDWECLGFTRDGGNAEFLLVPAANCLKMPDEMSFVAGAVSTDAFGTLYSACRKLDVAGDTTVAIFGIGPMGSAGILAAKACGARVIAVDPLEVRREFALELGADAALDSGSIRRCRCPDGKRPAGWASMSRSTAPATARRRTRRSMRRGASARSPSSASRARPPSTRATSSSASS